MSAGQALGDDWDFDDIELDFSDSFENEEQVTAPEFPKEGIYHVSVQDINASNEKVPGAAFFVFEIITGNVDGQQGKTVRYVVWPPSQNAKNVDAAKKQWMKTILQVMLAFGLRKRGEFPKVRANSDFWDKFEGRQCMARVTHKDQTRTTESGGTVKFTNAVVDQRTDLMPLFSEDVASIPYDEAAAEMGGYKKSKDQKSEEI